MNSVKKINLSNLKKCNQVWTDMPINERGRLCLKCSNTIIDFRSLTDSQIAETHLFSEHKVCGLYNKKQLQETTKRVKEQKLNKWNSFYLGLFSFLSFNSYGQESSETVKIEQTEKKYNSINKEVIKNKSESQSVVKDSIIISGKMTDENNEPLPGGNVIIKGTRIGASSDFDGFYTLSVTKELASLKKLTLIYSYIGYETTEKIIDPNINKRVINIELKYDPDSITEFMITYKAPFHKRIWYTIKNIFRKKR